jgi:hypothetical protein
MRKCVHHPVVGLISVLKLGNYENLDLQLTYKLLLL